MAMRCFILVFIFSFSFAQNSTAVDFTHINANIDVSFKEKLIRGSQTMVFKVLKPADTIRIDAKNIIFSRLKINGKHANFKTNGTELLIFDTYVLGKNVLTFNFISKPKQCVYFVGNNSNFEIWTQGQGKFTSHWLPSFDDVNEKVIFGLSIRFDKNFTVLSNGLLKKVAIDADQKVWTYQMQKPMSSYLLMFSIGKFAKRFEKSSSGIVLENYLHQDDISKFETTFRFNKEIFDFIESEIGVRYPWEVYRQVPAKDFLYGGMENTSATIFSQDYVIDDVGYNDRNYINVNAHELAHQWFGDLITAKSGKHHWLQEGFATYYALLAEKKIFGDDHFNWKMYEMAERIQRASKTDTVPILNEKASSISFYQKGAWAIHVMRTKIGEDKFQTIIKNYLNKHQFQNVTTDDFFDQITKISDFDVNDFKAKWLENPKFEINEVLAILKKNKMLQQYFEISELKDVPFERKKNQFEQVVRANAFFSIKQEIVAQLQKIPFDDKKIFLRELMSQNNWQVRQTIAALMTDFPDDFKADYETLLLDKSYITKEIALNILWEKYPQERSKLLENTKDWIGFNDYNLRVLWLNLALRTNDYVLDDKTTLYDELLGYSSNKFETSTRQNAIKTLIFLDKNDQNYLPNIVNGLTSHRWQMVKFCKDRIRFLLKTKEFRDYFVSLSFALSENERKQLDRLLQE